MNFTARRLHSTKYIFLVITGFIVLCCPSEKIMGQAPEIRFSGFVKTDMYLDTRNTVSAREGQFMLFPMNKEKDAGGNDINRNTRFNLVAIQTRIQAAINGPDAFGAETSGLIETAFFGSAETNINTLRMRHAWVNLDWEQTNLLVGQYWHPLFVPQSFPGTVSFSTGTPFQAFSRNPQVRLTHTQGGLTAIVAALTQRDFTGPGGSESLQNSAVPNLHAQLQGTAGDVQGGIGIDFKRLDIVPHRYEPVNSFSWFGFLNLPIAGLTSKSYVIYGENLQDQMMLGGIVRKAESDRLSPIRIFSFWQEFTTGFRNENGRAQYEWGLFAGYSQNLGTNRDEVTLLSSPEFSPRGSNIDYLYRIAPRFQVQSGPVRFSLEADMTTAAYGSMKSDGTVTDADPVTNFRLLLGAWLFF